MKAVKTRYSENRLKGLLAVGSLALLSTGSKNFLQSVNTDIIQVNAEKQAKAGFNAKVVRRTEPNCCSWCASLAGTYTPEEAKAKGIYARHEGCVCTIDFYPSKGKRQRISNYMKDAKTQEKLAAASGREERIALAKNLEEKRKNDIIEKIKNIGFNGTVNIPPKKIDTSILVIDEKHVSKRNHKVTKEEAINFIKEAKISFSVWNETYEKFFSIYGAAYVDMGQKLVKTAFRANEYDKKQKNLWRY